MSRLETSQHLVTVIARSMMFRTFARVYENEFGVPLYFESPGQRCTPRTPSNESDFCTRLNGGDGCCTECVCRILPPPEALMAWTWSAPCRAGMRVTMVPLLYRTKPIAWLVSGHYFIGVVNGGFRELPREVMHGIEWDGEQRKSLMHAYSETKSIPRARHDLMVRYLETCCGLMAANLNHFLTGGDEAKQAAGFDETATRSRLEQVRRRFLRTPGEDANIAHAAKEAGWPDEDDFRRDFQECFGESPSEHWKKVTGLWHDFSCIVGGSDQEPAELNPAI